ncbi:MAG: hypothetical protein APF84_18465 [Gracilibacter sp. BRH_c7a]|nr:MAG: hypothetical protein APF84_18465 [Gracilibacter sp. BRH_c7a]
MAKVLIVDDEKSIRNTLAEFLRKEGYEVETAEEVNQALALLRVTEFDLVITDIVMPRISGIELLQQIRQSNPDIQVIIMTGEPTVDTAVKAVQVGAYDYISKPIVKSMLIKVVKQAIHLKGVTDKKKLLEYKNHQYQKNLEQLVEERTKALHNSMQSTIMVLASMVSLRDAYTAGHQMRVGNLAAAIGEEMDLAPSMVEGLRVTGYLHDIGKVTLPAEILAKPGKITKLEFEIIKTHAAQGYEILKDLRLPWSVAEVIYQHHERKDGSGYPDGLKNQEIMMEARVLIVADVVEAMSSHRPYRSSLGIEATLKEIRENSGILYDSDVAEACLRLFERSEVDFVISGDFAKTNFVF